MGEYVGLAVITLATLAFIWVQLRRTNMTIPPQAEEPLSTRERLQFALDNDVPIIRPRFSEGKRGGLLG